MTMQSLRQCWAPTFTPTTCAGDAYINRASLEFFVTPPPCSGDVDRSVRACASQLLLLLVRRCGKAIAPHLKVSAHVHRQVVPLTLTSTSSACALHCGWRAATLHSKRSRFVFLLSFVMVRGMPLNLRVQAAAEAWAAAFPTKEKQQAAATAVSTELLAGLCDAACITPASAVERGMCEESVAEELVERSTFHIGSVLSTACTFPLIMTQAPCVP